MTKESKHTHGFQTPEHYFDELNRELVIQSKLSELPQRTGYTVPEDYFSGLESKIVGALQNEKEQVSVLPLFRKRNLYYLSGIAASLIIGFSILNTVQDSPVIDTADASYYIENGGLNLNTFDLAQLLTDEDISEIVDQSDFFSEESLDTYLLEHFDESILLQEE